MAYSHCYLVLKLVFNEKVTVMMRKEDWISDFPVSRENRIIRSFFSSLG